MEEGSINVGILRRNIITASSELGTEVGRQVNQAKANSELKPVKETVIKGDLILEKNTEYPGDLYVYGRIISKDSHSLKVNGNAFSRGIEIKGDIEVIGSLHTLNMTAHDVAANGAILAFDITAHAVTSNRDIIISSNADVNSIIAKGRLEIGGSLTTSHAEGIPLVYDAKLFRIKKSKTKAAC
jgi:hypothetical protein